MERVYILQEFDFWFGQKCVLKGTKFRDNCQNTDLYQQTVNFRIGHPQRPRSLESTSSQGGRARCLV